mgnify:CR=1 FL=1
MQNDKLFPTTVVGSYPQPVWLVDHERLKAKIVPRVRAPDIWRVPEPWLAQAQDDATLLAIRAQERAGIDIITDGEMRRESYSNRFATSLSGLDLAHPFIRVAQGFELPPVKFLAERFKILAAVCFPPEPVIRFLDTLQNLD